jgi:NAD-dependent deacetylase
MHMTPSLPQDLLHRATKALATAKRVLAITGAGISAESGLPTYRGIGGLYNDPQTEDGIPIEVALSGQMFRRRPELTWRYIHQIERACRDASPNRAHQVLALLETRALHVAILTQNVDGFHRQAGSNHVIDIHGDLHALRCSACEYHTTVHDYAALPPLPRCPRCDAVVRPDVVLFGELLPLDKTAALERELEAGHDVVLSIGTTSVFPYIAGPVLEARRKGVPTIEVNPGQTEVSDLVDIKLAMTACEACEALWQRLTA